MTVFDVLTSWVAWPLWVAAAGLIINGIVEHLDGR